MSSSSSSSSSESIWFRLPSQSSVSESSYTASDTSSSSSSQTGPGDSGSKLVLFKVFRSDVMATYVCLVDLSDLDSQALELCGKPRIDPGGVFNGYPVWHQSLPIKNDMRFVLRIQPRQDLTEEDKIYQEWTQNILSQLRAGIATARQEAEILELLKPQHYRTI